MVVCGIGNEGLPFAAFSLEFLHKGGGKVEFQSVDLEERLLLDRTA